MTAENVGDDHPASLARLGDLVGTAHADAGQAEAPSLAKWELFVWMRKHLKVLIYTRR